MDVIDIVQPAWVPPLPLVSVFTCCLACARCKSCDAQTVRPQLRWCGCMVCWSVSVYPVKGNVDHLHNKQNIQTCLSFWNQACPAAGLLHVDQCCKAVRHNRHSPLCLTVHRFN